MEVSVGEGLFKFNLEGSVGTLPPGAKPLPFKVTHTDSDGNESSIEVYDTNGDGAGDHGVLPVGSIVKGSLSPSGPHQATYTPGISTQMAAHGHTTQKQPFVFIPYENDPVDPMPVVFTKTADEYLADYGLDFIANGENTAFHAIESFGGDVGAQYQSGFMLDVRMHWNTEAGWVDIEQFPSLAYEFYGLPDVPGTWPHYVQLRVAGDGGAVLNWLAHHGVTEVEANGLDVTGTPTGDYHFDHVRIQIDKDAGLALIEADDASLTVPLGW